jgi:hypothetical protein
LKKGSKTFQQSYWYYRAWPSWQLISSMLLRLCWLRRDE